MTARRFSLWQKVAALAPVLLLLVYLPGQTMLRCRLDGQLREVCCCPSDDDHQDSQSERSSGTVLRAQDCCDRQLSHGRERPVAEAGRAAHDHDSAAMASLVVAMAPALEVTLPRARSHRAAQRLGLVYDGPPLVLLKHAFLI